MIAGMADNPVPLADPAAAALQPRDERAVERAAQSDHPQPSSADKVQHVVCSRCGFVATFVGRLHLQAQEHGIVPKRCPFCQHHNLAEVEDVGASLPGAAHIAFDAPSLPKQKK